MREEGLDLVGGPFAVIESDPGEQQRFCESLEKLMRNRRFHLLDA